MISSSSHSPFKPGTSRSTGASIGRRVFTRPPFASKPVEPPQVADDGGSFISRPVAVTFDDAPGFGPDVHASRSRTVSARVLPPTLHRRDRSLYAWFESVGFLLGALSVSGACIVLVLG